MKYTGLSLILILFLTIPSSLAFSYEVTYYINESTGTSLTTTPVPFFAENVGTIELDLGIFSRHNTTSSFTYNGNYLSPYSNTYALTNGTRLDNSSCADLGSAIINYTSTRVIESRNTLTNDADFFAMSSQSAITFATNDRFLRLFSGNRTDSEQLLVNKYQCIDCLGNSILHSDNITTFFNSDNVGLCQNVIPTRANARFTQGATDNLMIYVLFNSATGNVTYSSQFFGASQDVRIHVIYPFDDPTNPTLSINTETTTGNIVLDANRLYVYAVGGTPAVGDQRVPDINLTIDLAVANYDCPNYGSCVDGFQTRTCTDTNEIQPDLVQNRPCSLIILQNATLGFEDFYTTNDVLKCNPSFGLFCFPYTVGNISVDRPTNWTVIDAGYGGANFLRMTSEYATEGTRSLKMWSIPPKEGEVIDNVTCGNLTTAIVPTVTQEVSNTTFSVSHNVTFPSTFMQIGFSVKKCDLPETQHWDIGGVLWSNISGERVYIIPPFCYQRCYANDCNENPRGEYFFNIIDTTTDQSIFGNPLYKTATNTTNRPLYTLNGLGIVVGRNYRIVFAASSENPNDARSNCVYFDDVHYQVSEADLTTLVPGCLSRCDGLTRYEAFLTGEGTCYVEETRRSSKCSSDPAVRAALDNGNDLCDPEDFLVLLRFDEKTGEHYEIDCEFGCESATCLTEEEAEAITIFEPPFSLEAILSVFRMSPTGELAGLRILFSTFAFAIYAIIIFSAIATILPLLVTSHAGIKESSILGSLTAFVLSAFLTVAGFLPAWVGWMLIIFTGVLSGLMIKSIITNNSGGG